MDLYETQWNTRYMMYMAYFIHVQERYHHLTLNFINFHQLNTLRPGQFIEIEVIQSEQLDIAPLDIL